MERINQFAQDRHQQIKKLVQQMQASTSSQEKLFVTNQIATTILLSRPLCRQFQGTPLTGVYQEMYQKAKKRLVERLEQLFFNSSSDLLETQGYKESLSPDSLYQLQVEIFKQLLDDKQLKQLGLAAQKLPFNSELRSYALTELVKAIRLSERLCRPHRQKFSVQLYQAIYDEALTETMCYVCLNIDLYDPERGTKKFMNWVNFKLDKTILKCYEKYWRYIQKEIPSSDTLDTYKQPSEVTDLSQALHDYLVSDPQQIFQNAYIRNRPEANFKIIALAKFSGKSWEEISQQLEIPVPTLSSFYNRWLRRFTPLLNTELEQYF